MIEPICPVRLLRISAWPVANPLPVSNPQAISNWSNPFSRARWSVKPIACLVFFWWLLAFGVGSSLVADISLPKVFSDNMVLQRNAPVRIWGTSDPLEELQVSLGQQSTTVVADEAGAWHAELASLAAGGPYELVVAGKETQVVLQNIMLGELWLCAGQTNMQTALQDSVEFDSEEGLEKFLSDAVLPNLRIFSVPESLADQRMVDLGESSFWQESNLENTKTMPGVAYMFAKHLRESPELADLAIGLVIACSDGATCESWISNEHLKDQPAAQPLLEHWAGNGTDRSAKRPSSLFNGMIAPLGSLAIRGVIWYQGESNVGRGRQLADLIPMLIADWRDHFQVENMPFLFVQLAPFRYEPNDPQALAEVWEAQEKALAIPHTGMALSVDIGDPSQIIPKNKEQVGRRLALLARNLVYGETELVCQGPRVLKSSQRDGKWLLQFENAEGLHCPDESIVGFQVCGDDQVFVDAQAELVDGTVRVWADEVSHPVAVRYLWFDSAKSNLFNGSELPAAPFRSDEFDLLSKEQNF